MTIAPIQIAITTEAPPELAFELFTAHMGVWWPRGKSPGSRPHVDVVIEPHVNGRWFERDDRGNETLWGHVLAWEPPHRLLLGWQLDKDFQFDATIVTEVELIFSPIEQGTKLTLEHRNLERLVDNANIRIRNGWPSRLADFQTFADHTATG